MTTDKTKYIPWKDTSQIQHWNGELINFPNKLYPKKLLAIIGKDIVRTISDNAVRIRYELYQRTSGFGLFIQWATSSMQDSLSLFIDKVPHGFTEIWCNKYDMIHRLEGPAYRSFNSSGEITQLQWHAHGKRFPFGEFISEDILVDYLKTDFEDFNFIFQIARANDMMKKKLLSIETKKNIIEKVSALK